MSTLREYLEQKKDKEITFKSLGKYDDIEVYRGKVLVGIISAIEVDDRYEYHLYKIKDTNNSINWARKLSQIKDIAKKEFK